MFLSFGQPPNPNTTTLLISCDITFLIAIIMKLVITYSKIIKTTGYI
jgi:hypothetical protein